MQLIKPTKCIHWLKIYQLYKKAFPIYERKPFTLIFNTFKQTKTDVWYIEDHHQFIGLAITMNDNDFILLDYFAIGEHCRNQGYGSQALQLLKEKYSNQRLFIEIESTLENPKNIHERLKRKQFYLRNGMVELGILANVFGVDMELLGFNKSITFNDYYNVYLHIYGQHSANHLVKIKEVTNENL